MSWSAAQYRKFEDERNRPIRDLLAQIDGSGIASAADIGCGPGNSTELVQQAFPAAHVIGIDSSEDMLAAARERLPNTPFALQDITDWQGQETYDLIFSNAVLQWVPDHATLLPKLLARLAPGGTLAVQLPDNFEEPSHQLMRQVAAGGAWAERLASAAARSNNRHSAQWYYQELTAQGTQVNIWRTTFFHPLAGGIEAIVEWLKGTGLRPFLAPLDQDEQAEFLARYRTALASAYPLLPDGSVILPFPRLFFVATRN